MRSEDAASQRHLVGRRLRLADAEVQTKCVFPFVDETWSVPYCLIDASGYGPRLSRGELEIVPDGLRTPQSRQALQELAQVPVTTFAHVAHFDPWWAFRGVAGVDRERAGVILATNIAGRFNHEGTAYNVHDLVFDARARSLQVLVAKDPVFETVTFAKGDLGLLRLRKPLRG